MNEQQRTTMELALEALESTDKLSYECWMRGYGDKAITAIKEALSTDVQAQPKEPDLGGVGVFHPQEPEQEPFAWADLNALSEQINSVNCGTVYRLPCDEENRQALYTTSPQRTWVGLTEEEKQTCIRQIDELGKYSTHTVADDERLLIDVVESKLRSKNA